MLFKIKQIYQKEQSLKYFRAAKIFLNTINTSNTFGQ